MKRQIIFAITLFSMCSTQCVQQDKETDPSTQPVLEMPESPVLEDPDPPVEEPPYAELFAANLSVDALKEIETYITKGSPTAWIRQIFEAFERDQLHAPGLKEILQTANVNLVLDVVNPEKPLDPTLEAVLKKMLELEGMTLPLPELSEIVPPMTDQRNGEKKTAVALEEDRDDLDDACAAEVREKYQSGFRGCGLDHDTNVQAVYSNYQRRVYEAEERLLRRNQEVATLSDEKLLQVGNLLRETNKLIQAHPAVDNYEEVRLKLTYVGLVYAYYFRINFPVLQEYALAVNQSFYEHEINTIEAIREQKLEEASAILQECIDQVNDLIEEEIERTCRGLVGGPFDRIFV